MAQFVREERVKVSVIFRIAVATAGFVVAVGCAGAPFSYTSDRCLGAYNQCRNQCPSIEYGEAQAACFDRCLAREQQCYAVGDDGAGSSAAQDELIGDKRDRAEKQADFERWKAQKERERPESDSAGDENEAAEGTPDEQ